MRFVSLCVCLAALGVASCSQKPQVGCDSPDAQGVTIGLIKDQLEKSVEERLRASDPQHRIENASVRAAVGQLVMTLLDVRTSREDPDSTKKFCVAKLHVVVPVSILDDADKARADAQLSTVSALADYAKIDREADAFSGDFNYDVQPTDKGDKVYSESSDFGQVNDFYSLLISSSLLRTAIEQDQTAQQQAVLAQQQQQKTAVDEQHAADLAQAKTENQLANQTIAAVWKNGTPEARAAMLDDQRAWIRKKTADCNVEAASASVDPNEQEIARLRCDTNATHDRTQRLQGSLGQP